MFVATTAMNLRSITIRMLVVLIGTSGFVFPAFAAEPISLQCHFDHQCVARGDCRKGDLSMSFAWNGAGWGNLERRTLEMPERAQVNIDGQTFSMEADYTSTGLIAGGAPEGHEELGEIWLLTYTFEAAMLSVHMPQKNFGTLYSGSCERIVS